MAFVSYQAGSITLSGSSTGITLGTTVTQGNSILLVSLRGGSNSVGQYNIRVSLSSDGTTVTATRAVSGPDMTIEYQVVEATEFTVQHFEKSIAAYGSHSQAITSVDTDYAFPICTGLSATGGSRGSDDFVSLEITTATNVNLEIRSPSSVTVAFQVVEMSSAEIASVQTVTATLAAVTNNATITTVDAAKSLIFATSFLADNITVRGRQVPILELTSSTNLQLRAASHSTPNMTVIAYVVEFVNLDVTSTATSGITGTTTTEVLGAAPTYGGAVINALMGRYSSAARNDDDSREEMFTADLSGSTWTFERTGTLSTAEISYSVFDWADLFSSSTYTLTAESGSYALTGSNAGLMHNRVLTAESGSYALSGQDADLFYNRVLTAESGSYALTGADTDLLHNRVLTAESGSYVLTGYDVTLDYSGAGAPTYTLTADAGSYTLSGSATSLLHNRRLAAESGSYSITGQDAGLYKGYRLVAEAGAYNLTGQVVDFSRAYRLEAESGTYTLTGQDTQILHNRRLVAESGTYTLTGYDVSLIYSPGATYTLTAESGSYALSGADTDLLHNRVLAAESGSYVLTGADAGIFHNRLLTAESGNYTLTGADVGFARSYRLAAESGGYGLTGSDVQLLYSGIAGEITGLLFKARLNRLPLTFKGSLGAEIVTYAPLNSGGIANRGRLNV